MRARSINGRVIPSNAARAVERFRPGGPIGYVSALGGPIRATRAEAEADWLYTIEGADARIEIQYVAGTVDGTQPKPQLPSDTPF